MTTIDELYCNIDDFNQFFYPEWEKTLLVAAGHNLRKILNKLRLSVAKII